MMIIISSIAVASVRRISQKKKSSRLHDVTALVLSEIKVHLKDIPLPYCG
jgi:hypothetical protein